MTEDPLKRLKETIKPNRPTFSFKTVSEARVLKIIRKLSNKNSFGTDGISSKVLKSAADVLAAPITFIINTSLTSGVYPTRWKTAKVIPILKKGDRSAMSNYRPIALLPVASKILEEVVRSQVSDHFEKNGLLPECQHGFRPSRSTTSALLSLEKKLIEAHENKTSSAMLLFDLSAAFDTLDHRIFLEKLRVYGVDDLGQRWFKSYLENRQQFVELGQARSSIKSVPWGSPQGAVCSPLIFTIFVADMPLWITYMELFGFADDTTGVVSHSDIDEACRLAETDAESIMSFMSSNYLVTNKDKTKFLSFVPSRNEDYCPREITIGGNNIIETSCEKVLGLYISNDLSWANHIQHTKASLRYKTCMLRRLARSMPEEHLRQLADGLILSKIRYGLSVYGGIVRTTEDDPIDGMIHSLEVTVNDVMRITERVSLKDHVPIQDLRRRTNIPSVNQMTAQTIITDAWKATHGGLPGLENTLVELDRSGIETRAKANGNVNVPSGSRILRKSFSHQGAVLWNALPKDINPILCQALGYAEYIRGEQIHPRTLAVNTAFILQGIQFFCPLNKYFILS